jgi:hypothetical protein
MGKSQPDLAVWLRKVGSMILLLNRPKLRLGFTQLRRAPGRELNLI